MKKERTRQPRARAGITLIEVIVAMTVLAIVATLMYTAFSQTSRNKRYIEAQLDRHHEARSGVERMARELSLAFVSAQDNPNLGLQVVKTAFIAKEEGSGSRIDFTSFSHQRLYRDAHESDQNELSYFVTGDPEDPSKDVLARREQRRIDDDPQTGGQVQILIRDVRSFELAFLDPLSGEWLKSWDTTQAAMQPNRLPTQVRIRVVLPVDHGDDIVLATRALLPLEFALNHATYRK
jgi:general secretion pathway protein J